MTISENARVWIYQSNRFFNAEEEAEIQYQLARFVSAWQAHGNQLAAVAEIKHSLFIVISVDEDQAVATGCSIDRLVKLMKDIESQLSINLFDRFQIAYRHSEQIRICDRSAFTMLIKEGAVSEETIVFNNLIQTRKALLTEWEVPFKHSWHRQVFI